MTTEIQRIVTRWYPWARYDWAALIKYSDDELIQLVEHVEWTGWAAVEQAREVGRWHKQYEAELQAIVDERELLEWWAWYIHEEIATIDTRERLAWKAWIEGEREAEDAKDGGISSLRRFLGSCRFTGRYNPLRFTSEGQINVGQVRSWRDRVADEWMKEVRAFRTLDNQEKERWNRWWRVRKIRLEVAERERRKWSVRICDRCGELITWPNDCDCPREYWLDDIEDAGIQLCLLGPSEAICDD